MSDIAPLESPVSNQNAHDAFNLLTELRIVANLLAGLDEGSAFVDQIDTSEWCDLGKLILRLTDHPTSLLGELSVEKRN